MTAAPRCYYREPGHGSPALFPAPGQFGEDREVHNEVTREFLRHYRDEYPAFTQRVPAANAPGHIGDRQPDPGKPSR